MSLFPSGRLLGAARWKSLLRQYGVPVSYLDHSAPTIWRPSCRYSSSTASAQPQPPSPASPTTPPLASHLPSSPSAHTASQTRRTLRLLRLHTPILSQLQLEESLLRLSPHSYLIINTQPPTTPPTIVLGISGRPEHWLNVEAVRRQGVLCVKRFTGGGTVYCDGGTFFVSLLVARRDVPEVAPYPQPLLEWSGRLYKPVFDGLAGGGGGGGGCGESEGGGGGGFNVRGNDYCFGGRKFAGNAQSITRDKLLHHTSFLHTVNTTALTTLLAMPPTTRRPAYRADRPHTQFVTSIADWMGGQGGGGVESVVGRVVDGLVGVLEGEGWEVVVEDVEEARKWMDGGRGKYDKVLKVIDWDEEMARIEREQAENSAKERSAG